MLTFCFATQECSYSKFEQTQACCHMTDSSYFVDHKRGEINELKGLLRNVKIDRDRTQKREVHATHSRNTRPDDTQPCTKRTRICSRHQRLCHHNPSASSSSWAMSNFFSLALVVDLMSEPPTSPPLTKTTNSP